MTNDSPTIQFAATPVKNSTQGKQSFVLQGNERNANRGVVIADSGVDSVTQLDTPLKGGTHWITITRLAAREHQIKDERDI